MRITFIANPAAGRGYTERFFRRFSERTASPDFDAEIRWTEAPGHATELARAARATSDVVCVVGGDGTVHEVVNGLMPEPVPVAIVPCGSGNDFASMFACARTPEELRSILTGGLGVRVDVLECNGRYCANSSGLGLEAKVTMHSLSIRRLRGLPLYLLAAFRALRSFDCPPMTIRIDDDETIAGRRLMVSVCNGPRAGGGFHLAPDALPDDGLMDLCIVDAMPRRRVLGLLPRAIRGGHVGRDGVTMRRARAVTIAAERPFHAHFDGEYIGETVGPLSFRLLTGALPVLCRDDGSMKSGSPPGPIMPGR